MSFDLIELNLFIKTSLIEWIQNTYLCIIQISNDIATLILSVAIMIYENFLLCS